MLIGLCGGMCAGKRSIAEYLVKHQEFQRLRLSEEGGDHPFIPYGVEDSDIPSSHVFPHMAALMDFVTTRWRERWVILGSWDSADLEVLLLRPFFLLVSVDAPILLRWKRLLQKYDFKEGDSPSLEQFVLWNDLGLLRPSSNLAHLTDRASIKLLNTCTTISQLHEALAKIDLAGEGRLRPAWDQYFMQLASLAAQRSNCMKRRVGCVLVREKRVISTGYNGTPRNIKNCNEGGCFRCNSGQGGGAALSTCLCLHAEENALLEAGRDRIRESSVLYCNTCPCLTCSVKIAQVGIHEVVYSQGYNMDRETAAILKEGNVQLRQFSPPPNGLLDLAATVGQD